MASTTSADRPLARPGLRFVLGHPARLIAFGFGSGLSPQAPGTMGTLATFPLFWALQPHLSHAVLLAVGALAFLVGIAACSRTGRELGVEDHPGLVVDEMAAFWLVLCLLPPGRGWEAAAFLLFRLLDIFKPPPIRQVERAVRGGLGVMLDDLLAAFGTLLLLALYRRIAHG